MLLPGRPRLRLGAAEKPCLPNEDGVREEEEGEDEEEDEEPIAPRAEAAAAERPRRLLLLASLSLAKWRGVVEKDW